MSGIFQSVFSDIFSETTGLIEHKTEPVHEISNNVAF